MESTTNQSAPTSKAMVVTGWVLSVLPCLMLIGGAVYGLMNQAAVKEQMQKFGFPGNSARWIIVVELVCAVIYLIPQTAVLGAILLTGYLGGAVATHVRAGEAYFIPIIVGVVIWLGLYLRDGRIRALVPFRSP